jgi:hypothetical protein
MQAVAVIAGILAITLRARQALLRDRQSHPYSNRPRESQHDIGRIADHNLIFSFANFKPRERNGHQGTSFR